MPSSAPASWSIAAPSSIGAASSIVASASVSLARSPPHATRVPGTAMTRASCRRETIVREGRMAVPLLGMSAKPRAKRARPQAPAKSADSGLRGQRPGLARQLQLPLQFVDVGRLDHVVVEPGRSRRRLVLRLAVAGERDESHRALADAVAQLPREFQPGDAGHADVE